MHDGLLKVSRAFAWAGGMMLCGLVLLATLSILGREASDILHSAAIQRAAPGLAQTLLDWGIGPISGTYEMIEAGTAFAVFAFLPLCQITGAHATVDIFAARFPPRIQRVLAALTEAVFAAVLVLIAVQLLGGMLSKMRAGQTSFIMQYPVWWGYAVSLTGAAFAAVVAVWMAGVRCVEMLCGHAILAEDEA